MPKSREFERFNASQGFSKKNLIKILEQEQLFCDFVEAERRVPRDQRDYFIITYPLGAPGVCLIHKGWPDDKRRVFKGDIDALIRAGLLFESNPTPDLKGFYVSLRGFKYYGELKLKHDKPIERIEQSVLEYIQSTSFKDRYPSAFSKWSQAENLLYTENNDKDLTTIGHLLREAMQEFASTLMKRFNPPNPETDKAKTVARIKAVINNCKLSNKVSAFLNALIVYWGTVSDLVQRQKHGAIKEGESLEWIDARRIVFHVALVIMEIDQAVSR